jgi:pyruvate dehydrogenase E1 component alpha subunit
VDGTDPVAVQKVVAKAADRARAGQGPSLVETKFYRLSAHGNVITVPPLPTQFPEHEAVAVYGNRKEFEQWKAKDPVTRFRSRLLKTGVLSEASAKRVESTARKEVEDAVQFALASPLPAPEEALNYVYA